MTVYVDAAIHPLGRMIMCHMTADTEDELHYMARRLELKREWFQNDGRHAHYDISKDRRGKALAYGATAISSKQLAVIARRLHEQVRHSASECGLCLGRNAQMGFDFARRA